MLTEFTLFLKEFKVIPLAIAFIIGTAATALISSLVNDVIMPIISPLIPGESWKTAMLAIGPINIAYGSFLSQLINFLILALIVFFIAKKMLKIEHKG